MAETTPDEQPKNKVAKKVLTPKRRYFVPEHGVSVLATNPNEAAEMARKQVNQVKAGDGE